MDNLGYEKTEEETDCPKKDEPSLIISLHQDPDLYQGQGETTVHPEEILTEGGDTDPLKPIEKGSLVPQFVAGIGPHLGAFAFGTVICWSATGVPSLRTDTQFIEHLTEAEVSWISSIMTLGAVASCLPAGFSMDRLGRRRTMLLFCLPFTLAWLLMTFAQNLGWILAGRLITGFSGVIFFTTAPIFLAEISEPRIQICILNAMSCVGILFQLINGFYFPSWRTQSFVCTTFPVTAMIFLYFVPESPRHLLGKGLVLEASASLCWLRGISKENQILVTEIKELNKRIEESGRDSKANVFHEMLQPAVRKAMLIGFMLFLFQACSGMIAIMFYRIEIFELAHVSLDEHTSSMIVGVVHVTFAASSVLVVDRFGRKILMIGSQIVVTLSLGGLGTFFYVQRHWPVTSEDHLNWLPLTSLILFVAAYITGLGTMPFSIIPEILPQKVRGMASSLLTACRWAMFFVMGRFYKDFMSALGPDVGYFTLATICFLGALYVFFCVPETKGKTLEMIQRGFLSGGNGNGNGNGDEGGGGDKLKNGNQQEEAVTTII